MSNGVKENNETKFAEISMVVDEPIPTINPKSYESPARRLIPFREKREILSHATSVGKRRVY